MASNTPFFKFVHTADVHLGSPLRSLAARDPHLAKRVNSATLQAFESIVDLCLEESVDALLIAGDLHDGHQKSMSIAAKLRIQLARLQSADIPVFMIRGNHDAMSTVQREIELPSNVSIFGNKDKPIGLKNGRVYIHGVSFKNKTSQDSLLPNYAQPIPNAINIGLLHTSLAGSTAHDVYAPCSIQELRDFGYDYWALGHIHKLQIHSENPTIVMPGIPQGRDIGEHGACSVTLVTVDDGGKCYLQQRTVGSAQFEHITLTLTSDEGLNPNALANTIFEKLESTQDTIDPLDLIARVEIRTSGALLYKLHRDKSYLEELLQELTEPMDSLWIESIKISEDVSSETNEQAPSGLAELQQLIEHSHESDVVLAQAKDELSALLRKLPTELRSSFQFEKQEDEDEYLKKAIVNGGQFLYAHLQSDQ